MKLGNKILHLLEANGNQLGTMDIRRCFKTYLKETVTATIKALVEAERIYWVGLLNVRMPKRKTIYMPPGIYPVTILEMMYPSRKYRIVITPDGKKPK